MTTTPTRPATSVGGRHGVDRDTRRMVADELRAVAAEIEAKTAGDAVAHIRARADRIEREETP